MRKVLTLAAVMLVAASAMAAPAWAVTRYYYRCTGQHEFYGGSGWDEGPFADYNSALLACERHSRANQGHSCYVFNRDE
jgi:hypothetical protein